MTLAEFLLQNRLSLNRFAKSCGLSAATILRARDATVMPSRKTLEAIVAATGGQVGVADLVQIPTPAAKDCQPAAGPPQSK